MREHLIRFSWASCLMIAPKTIKPFIRICSDYMETNKYIATGHYYIVKLDKIITYPMYLDIYLTNAFHQILLHPDTMGKLSVQTSWGNSNPSFNKMCWPRVWCVSSQIFIRCCALQQHPFFSYAVYGWIHKARDLL